MRQRRHHSKVTSGCKTCKARRIKCDEGKPFCKQCKTSGRACGGYDVPKTWMFELSKPKVKITIPSVPTKTIELSEQNADQRAMTYFQEKTVPQLKFLSKSSDRFWHHDILMFGATWPPVKHLIIALASRHELVSGAPKRQEVVQTYVHNYAAALSGLLDLPVVGTEDVFLMCCFLLIALEAFGDPLSLSDAAVKHVNCGLRIIDEMCRDGSSDRARANIIDLTMKPLFARIASHLVLFLPPESSEDVLWEHWHTRPEIPSAFRNLKVAKRAFFDICRWRHQHSVICDKTSWTSTSPEFSDIQSLLEQWWKAFKAYERQTPLSDADERRRIVCFESSFRFLTRTFRASVDWALVRHNFKLHDLVIDLRDEDNLMITYTTKSSILQEVVAQQNAGPFVSSGPMWLWPVTTIVGKDDDKFLVHSVLSH